MTSQLRLWRWWSAGQRRHLGSLGGSGSVGQRGGRRQRLVQVPHQRLLQGSARPPPLAAPGSAVPVQAQRQCHAPQVSGGEDGLLPGGVQLLGCAHPCSDAILARCIKPLLLGHTGTGSSRPSTRCAHVPDVLCEVITARAVAGCLWIDWAAGGGEK